MARTGSIGSSPPPWGVQYTLCLPTEDAARRAAAELAAAGHRLTAIRAHGHAPDPELTSWWQVFSLAVHTGHDRLALEPFLRHERIRMAGLARSHGGFHQGSAEGHASTLEKGLADAVAHQGDCTDDTVEAVPFLAELARDGGVPPAVRVTVLGDLLRLAAAGASLAVLAADRVAALGDVWQERADVQMTRRAIGRALPRLLARWDEEGDAARFVLAALAAAASDGAAAGLLPRLKDLPAPAGSPRADTVALIAALLTDDEPGLATALRRLTSWRPALAERTATPHAAPRQLALAVLPDLVMEDAGPAD